MMDFESDSIKDYDEWVAALERFEYQSKPKRLELHIKNRKSSLTRPSIEKALKLELKALPPHLRYVFLGIDEMLPVVIAANSNGRKVECLVMF